jgi:hypothetical protein
MCHPISNKALQVLNAGEESFLVFSNFKQEKIDKCNFFFLAEHMPRTSLSEYTSVLGKLTES